MRVEFTKMHGLGNDFVVIDDRADRLPAFTPERVRMLADRHVGIGCDQFILLKPSADATCRMVIHNADGGEVEACGNASRAVGLLLGEPATLQTLGGTIATRPDSAGISVDMGEPRLGWDEIPLAYAMDTLAMPLGWDELEQPVAVNVGNPHAIFFVPDCDAVPLEQLGPQIEHDAVFPERVNVNVATVVGRETIRLRVWERGVGLTRACGTGACATAVAAMRRGLTEREVTVILPGGPLRIGWGADNRITMTGPATVSFRGSFAWDDFA
ncbi:diaminopimelate epimerase [Aurantiacibacter xanthus]|uniref:Diaminopimelate epimerase n=1 Tax=Aurantiacibacter xanthus TaxID=1784712 RepID=A0A3A1PG23_9SPHN|nr:diaminopimelate epimerase [Aurantiacibacter xanthus]RIV92778.1 diaminopimelate epimerase [Aurantiacibacter xanthus]